MSKYTKAVALSQNTAYVDIPDAIYVGYGYGTDSVTAEELGSPDVWLDADSGLTEDRGDVESWDDRVNGLEFTSPSTGNTFTGGNPPEYNSGDSTSNNKPYVTFDRSNDEFLRTPASDYLDQGTGAFTVIMYLRFTSVNTTEYIMAKEKGNNEWGLKLHYTNKIETIFVGDDPATAANITDGTWYSLEWSYDGTTHRFYVDGVASGTTTTTSIDFDDDNPLYIGCTNQANGYFLDGDIAEILYYGDSALSATERTTVNDYFSHKYKESVSGDITYYSSAADLTEGTYNTTRALGIGEIHNISPHYITAATNASDIVGLYE